MYVKPMCKNCKYFSRDRVSEHDLGIPGGECRRKPPTVHYEIQFDPATLTRTPLAWTYFPMTRDEDFCGEFKAHNDW